MVGKKSSKTSIETSQTTSASFLLCLSKCSVRPKQTLLYQNTHTATASMFHCGRGPQTHLQALLWKLNKCVNLLHFYQPTIKNMASFLATWGSGNKLWVYVYTLHNIHNIISKQLSYLDVHFYRQKTQESNIGLFVTALPCFSHL